MSHYKATWKEHRRRQAEWKLLPKPKPAFLSLEDAAKQARLVARRATCKECEHYRSDYAEHSPPVSPCRLAKAWSACAWRKFLRKDDQHPDERCPLNPEQVKRVD
jgi:hypothetical protein